MLERKKKGRRKLRWGCIHHIIIFYDTRSHTHKCKLKLFFLGSNKQLQFATILCDESMSKIKKNRVEAKVVWVAAGEDDDDKLPRVCDYRGGMTGQVKSEYLNWWCDNISTFFYSFSYFFLREKEKLPNLRNITCGGFFGKKNTTVKKWWRYHFDEFFMQKREKEFSVLFGKIEGK